MYDQKSNIITGQIEIIPDPKQGPYPVQKPYKVIGLATEAIRQLYGEDKKQMQYRTFDSLFGYEIPLTRLFLPEGLGYKYDNNSR